MTAVTTLQTEYAYAQAALETVRSRCTLQPEAAIILGSSQGAFAQRVRDAVSIPYRDIPGMPVSTVPGHAGELKIGFVAERPVAVFCGRSHLYEGRHPAVVVRPVRLLKLWEVPTLIVTNAAGGLDRNWQVGDFMVIRDHLNLMGRTPLLGDNDERFGPRFPDLSHAYDPDLRRQAHAAASKLGLTLREGVYAAGLGPAYETPAEIVMLRTLGADAVGMSTVPEVIAAAHQGTRVLGLSMITNLAAGLSAAPLSHEDVKEAGRRVQNDLFGLLEGVVAAR